MASGEEVYSWCVAVLNVESHGKCSNYYTVDVEIIKSRRDHLENGAVSAM